MQASTPSSKTIRFGPFVANLRAGELLKNGTKLKFQEQPFKTLALLLKRRGEIVTREEIREALWPDNTYVDFDHGINMAVRKIREALGDCAEEPKFVETVGRRGYRFIALAGWISIGEKSRLLSSLLRNSSSAIDIRKLHFSNTVGEDQEVNPASLARDRLWTRFLIPQPKRKSFSVRMPPRYLHFPVSVIPAPPLFSADHVTTATPS